MFLSPQHLRCDYDLHGRLCFCCVCVVCLFVCLFLLDCFFFLFFFFLVCIINDHLFILAVFGSFVSFPFFVGWLVGGMVRWLAGGVHYVFF